MRLSDLTKKTKKIVLELDGETAEVEYRVHALTAKLLTDLRNMDDIESVIRQVESTVARWELLDEHGKEIPVSKDAILEFDIPMDFLTKVLNLITEDIKREKSEKNA